MITEKATLISEHNQVTFLVAIDATEAGDQGGYRDAVQGQGESSEYADSKGQEEALPWPAGQRPDIKKAIVTLAEGHSIDVTTGL